MHSARVPTPHNRSQHIQDNTTRGFIQSVLLTMGIMMPETCWVNLLWINISTCVICWFFLLLRQWCMVTRTWSLCERYLILDNLTTVFKSFKFSFMYIVNNLKESNLPWHNNFLKPAADGPGNWECNWTVRAGTVYDDGCCVLLERNSLNIYECKKSLINKRCRKERNPQCFCVINFFLTTSVFTRLVINTEYKCNVYVELPANAFWK